MSAPRGGIDILTVPLDLGAGRRGTDMGPSAIRIAGLTTRLHHLGIEVRDHGHIPVAAPETRVPGNERMRFVRQIVHVCSRLRDRVRTMLDAGGMPLILGGDHSIAMGTVAGVCEHMRERGQRKFGLLWIDAHADMNTQDTSPTGNVHGMPLSAILGLCGPELSRIGPQTPMLDLERVVMFGIRDVDPGESERIRGIGVRAYSMKEIDERGIRTCIVEALGRVTDGTAGFHLSFDMDSLDPEAAPGVGTPVPGGLTYREAHLACELAAETGSLISTEWVEVNPILDDRNRTGRLAVGLILSALGKRIY